MNTDKLVFQHPFWVFIYSWHLWQAYFSGICLHVTNVVSFKFGN